MSSKLIIVQIIKFVNEYYKRNELYGFLLYFSFLICAKLGT